MNKARKLIVLGIGGVVAYLLLKRSGGASITLPQAPQGPLNLTTEPASSLATVGVSASTQDARIGQTVGTAGGMAVGAAFGSPQAGAAIGGVLGSIGGAIFGLFADKPLEPVSKILIAQMPYAWDGRTSVPPGAKIYALDRYGYLWPLRSNPEGECGWLWREVIAVNWKVFSMMPIGNTTICRPEEIDRMPRPLDGQLLRAAFGNDIRFNLGATAYTHGPWESNANVAPAPGTPAQWGAIAGDFTPTVVSTPGDW